MVDKHDLQVSFGKENENMDSLLYKKMVRVCTHHEIL